MPPTKFSEAEDAALLRGYAANVDALGHAAAKSKARTIAWAAIQEHFVSKGFDKTRLQLRARYRYLTRDPERRRRTEALVARYKQKLVVLDEDEDEDDADAVALLRQPVPAAAAAAGPSSGHGEAEAAGAAAVRAATLEGLKIIRAATQAAVESIGTAAEAAAMPGQPMDLFPPVAARARGGNGPADLLLAQQADDIVVVDTVLHL